MKQIFFIFLAAFLQIGFAQTPDLVRVNEVSSKFHKGNIGKIFFTDKKVEIESLKPADFLDNYILTNKSDLFFVAFFDNSVTNYKHRLSPGISADSLFRSGNYRFTLFIDDKKVYESNLMPGAPSRQKQDAEMMLNRPLIDNINGQGSWSESFWNRFLTNGGKEALTDGEHLLRMEIRAYVKDTIVRTGPVLAAGDMKIRVALHPKIDIQKITLGKVIPYDGFPVSDDYFHDSKIRELKGLIAEGVFKKINGIVVIKNGKLLIEEYFNGEDRHSLHDPRSVGKSFVSTLIGQAIADGYIKDENQQLDSFYELNRFEHYTREKEQATLFDLLTMSSGFDGDDENYRSPGNEDNMYPTGDWVKFALDLPYNTKFRQQWHYFTAGVILLGDIANKSVPGGLEKYAHERLFKPLNIVSYKGQYTPQQIPNTAGGIRMNALDFAKYGQLYKNGGMWNAKQIIAREWVAKSLAKHKKIAGREAEYYGYLFWNKNFTTSRKSYEAFYCAGNGGNYILIFKDQPLVVVITASAYGQSYAHSQIARMLSDYILPAVIE